MGRANGHRTSITRPSSQMRISRTQTGYSSCVRERDGRKDSLVDCAIGGMIGGWVGGRHLGRNLCAYAGLNAYVVARDTTKWLRDEAVSCLRHQVFQGDFDAPLLGVRRLFYKHESDLT